MAANGDALAQKKTVTFDAATRSGEPQSAAAAELERELASAEAYDDGFAPRSCPTAGRLLRQARRRYPNPDPHLNPSLSPSLSPSPNPNPSPSPKPNPMLRQPASPTLPAGMTVMQGAVDPALALEAYEYTAALGQPWGTYLTSSGESSPVLTRTPG